MGPPRCLSFVVACHSCMLTHNLLQPGESSTSNNPRWCAPELLRSGHSISTQSDMWSFGCVCFEISMAGLSALRDTTILRDLEQGRLPDHPGHAIVADDLWALMRKCWRKLESRPSASDVKSKLLDIRGLGEPMWWAGTPCRRLNVHRTLPEENQFLLATTLYRGRTASQVFYWPCPCAFPTLVT